MNLIFLYMLSRLDIDEIEIDEKKEKEKIAEGFVFAWMVNVALDIYLISQLSTIFGG